jgi:hypothetical protein
VNMSEIPVKNVWKHSKSKLSLSYIVRRTFPSKSH